MSKRKREIKKRKQLEQELEQVQQAQEHLDDQPEEHLDEQVAGGQDVAPEAVESTPADTFTDGPGEPEFDDGDIVASSPPPAPKASKKKVKRTRKEDPAPAKSTNETSWLGQNKENLLLGMLVLYVFLLGLGTMGELFEIEWILNLPLFR
jgi:hypothetical protein